MSKLRQLFCEHVWKDITTPWNHPDITHLECIVCRKIITAFLQKYKRIEQGRETSNE